MNLRVLIDKLKSFVKSFIWFYAYVSYKKIV